MKQILFLCSLVLLTGCFVQSIYPFYTKETKVELDEINGEWLSIVQLGDNVKEKNITPWSFSKKTVITYDEKNIKSKLDCTYFKIGENLFVDTKAGEPDTEFNLFWSAGITLVHTVCKVELHENSLDLIPMNFDWIEKRIKEQKLNLSYVKADKDSNYIFTATSENWGKFLKEHGDNLEVFKKKYIYSFKRR